MSLKYKLDVRLSSEDVELLDKMARERGWSRSEAIRWLLREIGKQLLSGDKDFEDFFVPEHKNSREVKLKCPVCNSDIVIRVLVNSVE